MKRVLLLSAVAVGVVGCVKQPETIVENTVDAYGNQVQTKIEFDKLGNRTITEHTRTPIDMTKFASINVPEGKGSMTAYNAPLGLNNIVDIPVFTGDIEDLTYLITTHTGYKYLPYSGVKISPIRVTYETHGKTALEAFTEVNNLVGANAIIKISEVAKTVQVIYPLSAMTFQ